VSQNEPFEKTSQYWGYTVRVASSVNAIFDEGPYGGYDLKINCTKLGSNLDKVNLRENY
jgi:predicted SPOUT superfamily RNA methylase MTH1